MSVAGQQNYKIGIYVRLSRDDERQGESVSIENQKLMLTKYCEEQHWTDYTIYCDDGVSGTSFGRPGVHRLIEDAKDGKTNLILVKDLSRFGRNYIQVGQFTDYLFPMIGVRFIAVNDGVDTFDEAKAAADFICDTNENDGVVKWIEENKIG